MYLDTLKESNSQQPEAQVKKVESAESYRQRAEDALKMPLLLNWVEQHQGSVVGVAGDYCRCVIAGYLRNAGFNFFGVFPERHLSRIEAAPGGADQEVLLIDPDEEDFNELLHRVDLPNDLADLALDLDLCFTDGLRGQSYTGADVLNVVYGQKEEDDQDLPLFQEA